MKVILQQDVPDLGRIGEIVRVADGYAFNYLIPRNLAVRADERNVSQLAHLQRMMEQKKTRQLREAQAEADRISGAAISIRRKTGEEDRLFGSVTNRDIADALAAEGIEVDRRKILLEEPIKTIGVFNVSISVHPDVEASLKVYVIRD